MSRVTIIPKDGTVIVDGVAVMDLDLSFVSPLVHAVQWFGATGWIETVDASGNPRENAPITSIDEYQAALNLWQSAVDAAELASRKPYPSWVLNPAGDDWVAPTPQPTQGHVWDEGALSWKSQGQVQAEAAAKAAREQANEEFEPAKLGPALRILTEKLLSADIAAETLPEQDAQAVTLLFPKWEGNGVAYPLGRVLQFDGHLYEVMQPHTSQVDWAPDVATTLFRRRYAPTGGIPLWQEWDGHNDSLYQVGSEVMHNGLHWVSNTPNNSWVPGEYGWDQVV